MSDGSIKLETLGCRLNAYESEVMRQHARDAGVGNVVVVNTCAVTKEALRKSRQSVRRSRRRNPDAKLVVTGCAAQIEPENFASIPGVDIVLGNSRKLLPDTWQKLGTGEIASANGQPAILVDDIMSASGPGEQQLLDFGSSRIAYAQIQNGCDHRCTFCIIPYGRGNSSSVPSASIVDQIRLLVDRGYREVVLTGVDLTSWGADLQGTPRLGNLVGRILKMVPDLPRLRLSSVDPAEVDDELLQSFASDHRLMPHLHLSLQAGDNMVLKRMKRRHLRDDVIELCHKLRSVRQDIVFGADIIAGFPTETREMHENTIALIRECRLVWLHVFPFSPRDGTPAARMPRVPHKEVQARAAELREVGRVEKSMFLDSQVGREVSVLMETGTSGRACNYADAMLTSPAEPGSIRRMLVDKCSDSCLMGSLASN